MIEIRIDRRDIIWSYLAQFLSMGMGALTLPFILNKLTTSEIGLNYIFITIGSIISLVDLGFAPQFARNFTYVLSGAQSIEKEGVGVRGNQINYELLKYLLVTARYIYLVLSLIAFILLITIGTPYVYFTTNEFKSIPNVFWIWIIYSLGIIFQILYSYYFSMLIGAGKIKEQKMAIVGNKILYAIILLLGLYQDWGLFSVAIAQLLSPFLGRIIAYHCFYTEDLKNNISSYNFFEKDKIWKIFKTLWYNAKKSAVMSVGAYAILSFSMFIAGLYLSLNDFATYGLMVQLLNILGSVSCTYIQILQPRFASLRTKLEFNQLISIFSTGLIIFYLIFILGALIIILFGSQLLLLIRSNAILPSRSILLIYSIIMFLEYNHTNFATLISSNNRIPFAPASIITGIFVCIGSWISLKYTNLNILGLILVQGFCQLAYQNWKWPIVALNDFNINFKNLLQIGLKTIKSYIRL